MGRVRLPATLLTVFCALIATGRAAPSHGVGAVPQATDPNFLGPCAPSKYSTTWTSCEVVYERYFIYAQGQGYSGTQGRLDPGPDAALIAKVGQERWSNAGGGSVVTSFHQFLGCTAPISKWVGVFRDVAPPWSTCSILAPPPPPPSPPAPPGSCEQEADAKAVIAAGGKVHIRADNILINGEEGSAKAMRFQNCAFEDAAGNMGPGTSHTYPLGPVIDFKQGHSRTINLNRPPTDRTPPSLRKEHGTRQPGTQRGPSLTDLINDMGGWNGRNKVPKDGPEKRERCLYKCGGGTVDPGGIRGSFEVFGFSLKEGSPAFTFGVKTFPMTDDAFFSLLISWDNIGDGDWLDISFEEETLWSSFGTGFEEGKHYLILVPASLARGRDGLLSFVLGSTGESQASVFIGDPSTMTFPDDSEVPINLPPSANAGPDLTIEAQGAFGATFALNASASSDPEGKPLSFMWESGGSIIGQSSNPSVTLPIGTHTYRLTVIDDQGSYSSDDLTVRVVDTTPPAITHAAPSIATLWPANHRMVPVTVAVSATDLVDPAPVCKVMWITSNETAAAPGSGPAGIDFELTGPLSMSLRASRSGRGTGRIYTAGVECKDFSGNRSTRQVTVSVAHDQGKR